MACTPADFKVRFPEFATVTDERIQLFIDDTVAFMGLESAGRWCNNYDPAQCYLAAHLLVVGSMQELGDSGNIAPIKKQEVDDVVIEQAVTSLTAKEGEFGSTSYGKRYLSYRQICFGGYIIGV